MRTAARLVLGSLLALGAASGSVWLWWQEQIKPLETVPQRVVIAPGSSIQQIAGELAETGIIRSPVAWRLWHRWQPDLSPKAGTYDLDPGLGLVQIAAQLDEGRGVVATYTIPEGWRIRQMAAYFEALGWFSAAEFEAAAAVIPAWLPPELPHLEGYLFPNTYSLALDQIAAEAVVAQMLGQFQQTALPLYSEQGELSLHEWVTLASIIEKEAVVAQERDLIAGVFWNRLELAMPLGADPTVEYFLNVRQTPERRLTYAEVATPSPYNTYINLGLPPTPIASPGLASLQAALAPAATDYLFFVARYDGSHVFSRTYSEHQAAQLEIIEAQGQ